MLEPIYITDFILCLNFSAAPYSSYGDKMSFTVPEIVYTIPASPSKNNNRKLISNRKQINAIHKYSAGTGFLDEIFSMYVIKDYHPVYRIFMDKCHLTGYHQNTTPHPKNDRDFIIEYKYDAILSHKGLMVCRV